MRSLLTALHLVLGLIALPFLVLLRFRTIGRALKGMVGDLNMIELNDPEHRDRIRFVSVDSTASLDAHHEVKTEFTEQVVAGAWRDLSDRITHWDQNKSMCPAGQSLAETAVHQILTVCAEKECPGHDCHPDPILIFQDETVELIETLASTHPDKYPLWAIAAQMRCHQGWVKRGPAYSRHVKDDGWQGMGAMFAKARWLLEDCDPVARSSPLLAQARHALLSYMPDADKYAVKFYEDWSDLNPVDQTPHRKHALFMLPRWFGDRDTLELEAQRAAARTSQHTGDAAYFSIYAEALTISVHDVLNIDPQAFAQGAADFARLRRRDPARMARLIETMTYWTATGVENEFCDADQARWAEIAKGIDAVRAQLIRNDVTAIHAPSWQYGLDGALFAISQVVQPELRDGASFDLSDQGLAVIDAQPEPA